MGYESDRTRDEIFDQIDKCHKAREHGSKWPGMTFEDGVMAALDWILGDEDVAPMDQE